MAKKYIMWPFGVFSHILVYFTKKNLATLHMALLFSHEGSLGANFSVVDSGGRQATRKSCTFESKKICAQLRRKFDGIT
jgi:hypothetical protein